MPVCTVNREEGPAYGAALLAAVGVGAFPDLAAAAQATLSRGALEQPDPARRMRRTKRPIERFRGSYGAARPGAVSWTE